MCARPVLGNGAVVLIFLRPFLGAATRCFPMLRAAWSIIFLTTIAHLDVEAATLARSLPANGWHLRTDEAFKRTLLSGTFKVNAGTGFSGAFSGRTWLRWPKIAPSLDGIIARSRRAANSLQPP